MNKSTQTIHTITEIGILAALGFVLDELQGIISKGLFVNGGSIGFAMIAVLIISFRRGTLAGFLTGLIMGLLDLATGPYVLNFWQVLLDYAISYSLVAVAGFFRPLYKSKEKESSKILILMIATIVGGMAKFVSHYLAGIIFWADPSGFAWNLTNLNPYVYCFIYNIAFIGPSIILCCILMFAIFKRAPKLIEVHEGEKEKQEIHIHAYDCVINPAVTALGIFLFVFYLIRYINSYESYYDGWGTDVSFNPDALFLFVTGFILAVNGIIAIVNSFKNKQNNRLMALLLIITISSQIIYSIARLIKFYKKGYDPSIYWIWFVVSIFLVLLSVGLYLLTRQVLKKQEPQAEQVSE